MKALQLEKRGAVAVQIQGEIGKPQRYAILDFPNDVIQRQYVIEVFKTNGEAYKKQPRELWDYSFDTVQAAAEHLNRFLRGQ